MLATARLFLKVRGHMANDDEDEEKTPEAPKEASPSTMLIQKKFLEQRKLFLMGCGG
jgi:hypothetical protein